MKKLLAMLLVLGLANFASATMSFNLVPTQGGHGFSPDDPLLPSEWVEIDIVYGGDVPLWNTGDLTVTIEGPGEFCGADAGMYEPPTLPIEEVWTWHPKFDPSYMYLDIVPNPGIHNIEVVDSSKIIVGGTTDLQSYLGIPAGDILIDHLNIHCTGRGEVIVTVTPSTSSAGTSGMPTYWDDQLLVEDAQALGSSITIYQIPEPMTIGLLGLGGLGLIRRRRR
jgi:hypothetical protein